MPKRHAVTVSHARWAQRMLRRGCAVYNMPNLSRYISVEWPVRFPPEDRDACGLATVGEHHMYVVAGHKKLQPAKIHVAARPFRIRILRSWWQRASWKYRREVLLHELAHIIGELQCTPCHTHGRRFQRMHKRLLAS